MFSSQIESIFFSDLSFSPLVSRSLTTGNPGSLFVSRTGFIT